MVALPFCVHADHLRRLTFQKLRALSLVSFAFGGCSGCRSVRTDFLSRPARFHRPAIGDSDAFFKFEHGSRQTVFHKEFAEIESLLPVVDQDVDIFGRGWITEGGAECELNNGLKLTAPASSVKSGFASINC